MKTMYRAETWLTSSIRAVEVEKTTAKMVVFAETGRRELKECTGGDWYEHKYCDTWAEAHAWLLEPAQNRVKSARLALNNATGALGNVKDMKEGEG